MLKTWKVLPTTTWGSGPLGTVIQVAKMTQESCMKQTQAHTLLHTRADEERVFRARHFLSPVLATSANFSQLCDQTVTTKQLKVRKPTKVSSSSETCLDPGWKPLRV